MILENKPARITVEHNYGKEIIEHKNATIDWETWCDMLERLSLAHGFHPSTVNSLFNPELEKDEEEVHNT